MNIRLNHAALALIIPAACGLLLGLAGCKAGGPGAKDELAGVTQFIANGSFEDMDGRNPKGWVPRSWQRDGDAAFAVEPTGHAGDRSAAISSEKGADASWVATVPVRPYSRYRLSGWIKTENLVPGTGRGAQINVDGEEAWRTAAVTGTQDWTRAEIEFDAGANDALEVTCLFGGWGESTGKAWFDDVELTRLSGRELGRPTIVIDAEKTGRPVSKYIYGQFIEHLGRCIYQGIWAEMLEDRKFFWPVGEGESPWKAVGESGLVKMDTTRPFTGAHTPRVSLNGKGRGGIMQEALALIEGKEYAGRVVLSGDATAAPVVVSLVWGEGPDAGQTLSVKAIGRDYKTFPFTFKAGASTENARLEITSSGFGAFKVGTVSLMPADNVDGMRPDTLALLKELDAPVYRWPGGNFVSGYDWRDGIGDRDRRPPRKNPAWKGVEHNDFGIDEFMDLLRTIGTEPYITVNSGLGDVGMAVEELEYANGAADTTMGKLRRGQRASGAVRRQVLGHRQRDVRQLAARPHAAGRVRQEAQRSSPRRCGPWTRRSSSSPSAPSAAWSETMLAERARTTWTCISEHFYCRRQARPARPRPPDADGGPRASPTPTASTAPTIPALQDKDIPIALDEWNYWYGPHVYGELGTRYFLKDALGIAAGLQRIRAAERHLRHGQLRPDGQRDRVHQDHEDGGGVRYDGPRPEALPAAVRDAPGHGRRRARAARRHGLLEGRDEKRPDAVHRQSDEDAPDDQARRREAPAAEDGQALPGRRR